jgi:hypothetical protein
MKNEVQKFRPQEQLVLDFFIREDEDQQRYSQSIELYDAIPKYFWSKSKIQRDENGNLPTIEREFQHRGATYTVQINPARIDGKEYYPSIREELVEDALRKIATEGRAERIKTRIGLQFTLYELRKELKTTGHTYSNSQLKEALEICSGTNLKLICKSRNDKVMLKQNIFPLYVSAEREEWLKTKARFIVEFNTLVTQSIEAQTYRQINYERSMKLSNSLARWLHKRMSHNYRQASTFENSYTITLTTIIRDSGITLRKRLSDCRKYARKALEELKQQQVIWQWNEEETKEGRKLVNVKFELKPSNIFSGEMKRANAKTTEIQRANAKTKLIR